MCSSPLRLTQRAGLRARRYPPTQSARFDIPPQPQARIIRRRRRGDQRLKSLIATNRNRLSQSYRRRNCVSREGLSRTRMISPSTSAVRYSSTAPSPSSSWSLCQVRSCSPARQFEQLRPESDPLAAAGAGLRRGRRDKDRRVVGHALSVFRTGGSPQCNDLVERSEEFPVCSRRCGGCVRQSFAFPCDRHHPDRSKGLPRRPRPVL